MEMKRVEKKYMIENQKPGEELVFYTKVFSLQKNRSVTLTKESQITVNDICLKTGLTAAEIVNRMIAYSAEHMKIVSGVCYAEDAAEKEVS